MLSLEHSSATYCDTIPNGESLQVEVDPCDSAVGNASVLFEEVTMKEKISCQVRSQEDL